MGGFDYSIGIQHSGYGREAPGQTNHVQLSPLLCCGTYALLPCDERSRVGLPIRHFPRMFRKGVIRAKLLFLLVLRRIKKVIAYLI
jgi:hypothetical protein